MTPHARSTARAPAIALALLSAGCGDFSNTGLVFGVPLPGPQLEIVTPADGDGQALTLSGVNARRFGESGSASLNWFLLDVTQRLVDVQKAATPTVDADGTRRYAASKSQGSTDWSRLTVEPADAVECALAGPDGETLRWTLEVADDEAGPFSRLAGGVSRGTSSAEGCGRFDYDAVLAADRLRKGTSRGPRGLPIPEGVERVTVDWTSEGAQHALRVGIAGEQTPIEGTSSFAVDATGGGHFLFAVLADAVRGRGRPADERVDVLLRWRSLDGPGRADFRISGGNADAPLDGVTCWNGQRSASTYALDPTDDKRPEQGDASTCATELPESPALP